MNTDGHGWAFEAVRADRGSLLRGDVHAPYGKILEDQRVGGGGIFDEERYRFVKDGQRCLYPWVVPGHVIFNTETNRRPNAQNVKDYGCERPYHPGERTGRADLRLGLRFAGLRRLLGFFAHGTLITRPRAVAQTGLSHARAKGWQRAGHQGASGGETSATDHRDFPNCRAVPAQDVMETAVLVRTYIPYERVIYAVEGAAEASRDLWMVKGEPERGAEAEGICDQQKQGQQGERSGQLKAARRLYRLAPYLAHV